MERYNDYVLTSTDGMITKIIRYITVVDWLVKIALVKIDFN